MTAICTCSPTCTYTHMYMHVAIQMILIVYHAAYTNIVALTVRVYVCYLKSHLSTCRLILFFPILVIGTERRDVISCLNLPEYTLLYANTFKANAYSVECHQLRREHPTVAGAPNCLWRGHPTAFVGCTQLPSTGAPNCFRREHATAFVGSTQLPSTGAPNCL